MRGDRSSCRGSRILIRAQKIIERSLDKLDDDREDMKDKKRRREDDDTVADVGSKLGL